MSMKSLNVEPTFKREFVWEQMFRSKTISDVALPSDHRSAFVSYVESGRIPSLIFYSPQPGTGKTTTARALSADIGCPDPLFINASLNNSIDNIRSSVVQYGSTVSLMGGGRQKVVILDECERLSVAAQESLKGLIEELSANCSFILTTNDISRVNKPLLSRCRRFDFIWDEKQAKTVKNEILRRVIGILNNREVPYDPTAIAGLVNRSFPDNRELLGTLQTYAAKHNKIDLDILNHVGGFDFNGVADIIRDRDFKKAAGWSMNNFERLGNGVFGAMFRYLCPYNQDGAEFKVEASSIPALTMILNEAQQPKNIGPDGYLHLLSVILEIINADVKIK